MFGVQEKEKVEKGGQKRREEVGEREQEIKQDGA
jgi:hypothetical protein